MTRVTLIVAVWLLLFGSIVDDVMTPGEGHPPLVLLALYAVVTGLALLALWVHLSEDPADALHPPRTQPFHWN